jgi:triosephosphate isomerase
MHTTIEEAVDLVIGLLPGLQAIENIDKVICPPFISLYEVKKLLKGTSIKLGAQNMYFKDHGAYTGEISPRMLANICDYVILGHSERRQYFAETNLLIKEKVKAAFNYSLVPILCIGETLVENEASLAEKVLKKQITDSLGEITPSRDLIIAYEPVWAIGTGKAATAPLAQKTIKLIRDLLSDLWNTEIAQSIRILYGGSVNSSNIAEFMQEPDIDGCLVGGASLKADEFVKIVEKAAPMQR